MTQLGHKDQKPNSILCTHTSYHASGISKKQLSYVTQDMEMHILARRSCLDAQR
jgi:hypothetical protein